MSKLFRQKGKPQRTDSRPLIEQNNNDLHEEHTQACNGYENALAQNISNINEEQLMGDIKHQSLAELLRVAPDADTSVDGPCCEPDSGLQTRKRLIQRSVSQHFPKPPEDLNKNLQQHLNKVQTTMTVEVEKLAPAMEAVGLMDFLIDCYHRKVCDHIHDLLQSISSPKNFFVLLNWIMHSYLSEDLQGSDPNKKVDRLLLSEVVVEAKDKLLKNVQKAVRGQLGKILENETTQKGREAHTELYVDTIQCIEAYPKEAQKISSQLCTDIQEVCYQELLMFLKRYNAEQTEMLGKEEKMVLPKTIHFFKTLKNCKELKMHIQKKRQDIKTSLFEETSATLKKLEEFTLSLLLEIVADVAERHLKTYFKTPNSRFVLLSELKRLFPKADGSEEIQVKVMNEVYKVTAHIYLKHLIQRSQKKLEKQWSSDIGQTIVEDANLLHHIFAEHAPDVLLGNYMLLKVAELLASNDLEVVKLTVATMERDCPTWSKDLDLLPAVLRWKGLPGWQVTQVLDLLDAAPWNTPGSVSCFSFLKCW